VSQATVRRLIDRALLRPNKAIRHIRIAKEQIDEFARSVWTRLVISDWGQHLEPRAPEGFNAKSAVPCARFVQEWAHFCLPSDALQKFANFGHYPGKSGSFWSIL